VVHALTEGFGLQRHHEPVGGLPLCLALLGCLSPVNKKEKMLTVRKKYHHYWCYKNYPIGDENVAVEW
jgi:hypothetical protein